MVRSNMKRIFLTFVCFALLPLVNIRAADGDGLDKAIELFEAQDYDQAKALLVPLADRDAEAAYYLGRICFECGDLKASLKWLRKAVVLDTNQAKYYFWLGNAYGRKAQGASIFTAPGYAKKIRENFSKAVELDPENLRARFALLQFYLQAPGIVGGSGEKAQQQADEIANLSTAWGHLAQALINQKHKEFDRAEKEYLAAVEADPDNLEMHYSLGYFYQQIGKYDQAFQTFENVLRDHPEDVNALYQIGKTGALSGQKLARAAECLREYLLTDPDENEPSLDWAHYRLGMVFGQMGSADSARVHYQAALSLNPNLKEAKKALKKLK